MTRLFSCCLPEGARPAIMSLCWCCLLEGARLAIMIPSWGWLAMRGGTLCAHADVCPREIWPVCYPAVPYVREVKLAQPMLTHCQSAVLKKYVFAPWKKGEFLKSSVVGSHRLWWQQGRWLGILRGWAPDCFPDSYIELYSITFSPQKTWYASVNSLCAYRAKQPRRVLKFRISTIRFISLKSKRYWPVFAVSDLCGVPLIQSCESPWTLSRWKGNAWILYVKLMIANLPFILNLFSFRI